MLEFTSISILNWYLNITNDDLGEHQNYELSYSSFLC